MRKHLHIAFAALLLIGLAVCPKPLDTRAVDPGALLLLVLEANTPRASLSPTFALIQRNYGFSVTGEDTIAGRKAWVLALRPRIKKRPFRQMWVDKKSFAILAVRDWSSANRLKRQTTTGPGVLECTRDPISRQPAKPAAFDLQRAVRGAERKLGWKPALPRCVPEGFEPVDIRLLSRGGWVQIVYSDGLYALSVFQRFPSRPGREHKRTIAVYDWGVGLLLSTNRADREVVVVADLAGNELESIGQSIR